MAAEIFIRSAGIVHVRPCFNEAAANGRGNPPRRPSPPPPTKPGFNEAAANGRGNPEGLAVESPGPPAASMRPRRMAAEIAEAAAANPRLRWRFNEAAANGRGNPARCAAPRRGAFVASMRPRRMAAEIGVRVEVCRPADVASMRPRRMAAEIAPPSGTRGQPGRRFNEAAANGRGNPTCPRRSRPACKRLQ